MKIPEEDKLYQPRKEDLEETNRVSILMRTFERLLLNDKMLGFLASRGDEFNLGPETRLDRSELFCNKVLLKYKRDRESY